jgi:hypothetical protein
MQNYAYARGGATPRGPRREGPAEEGFVRHSVFFIWHLHQRDYQLPPLPTHGVGGFSVVHANPSSTGHNSQIPDKGRPTFGVDLAEQMARDNIELPMILEKCCAAIEKYGLHSQGIYRISGMARKVASLKERLDKGSYLEALFGFFEPNHYLPRHGLRQLGFGRVDI